MKPNTIFKGAPSKLSRDIHRSLGGSANPLLLNASVFGCVDWNSLPIYNKYDNEDDYIVVAAHQKVYPLLGYKALWIGVIHMM